MKMKKLFLFLILGFFLISSVSASLNYRTNSETVFSVGSGDTNYILENFGIGTTTPTSKLEVIGNITTTSLLSADSVTISNDFNLGNGLIFVDKSNGVINFGSLILGTDRLNVFAPTTGVQTGIASFYDSSQNIKFRMRDEWTANSIPPRFESHSALGFGLLTTQNAPFIWYVDGTNNEKMRLTSTGLGIGTTSPSTKLDVQGDFKVNGSSFFVNSSNGFVGIGTATPAFPLDVRGIVSISAGSARIELEDILVNGSDWWILPSTGGTTDQFRIYDRGEDADRFIIDGTGKIGIGTTSPAINFHILTGGSSELGSTVANRGIAITGISGRSRIYFEATDAPSGERVFMVGNSGGVLSFGSLNNTASAFTNENILTLNHNTGRVGIGTSVPVRELDVTGGFRVTDGTDFFDILTNGDSLDLNSNDVIFVNNNRNFNLILLAGTSTGNVGIGTSSPTQKLNVIGDLNITGNYIINGSIGFTGSCVNITYSGGIAVSCND